MYELLVQWQLIGDLKLGGGGGENSHVMIIIQSDDKVQLLGIQGHIALRKNRCQQIRLSPLRILLS